MPRHDEPAAGIISSSDAIARMDEHQERLKMLEDRKGILTCTTCGERAVINVGGTAAHHMVEADWVPGQQHEHRVTLTHSAIRAHLAVPLAADLIDLGAIRGLTIAAD